MSITANSAGGNTTITITRTVTNARGQAIIASLMSTLFENGASVYPRDANGDPVTIASLSDQDKLDILEAFMVKAVTSAAAMYERRAAQASAGAGIDEGDFSL